MKVSSTTHELANAYGDEEAIRILADAGFEAVDFTLFRLIDPKHPYMTDGWEDRVDRVKRLADSLGVSFAQSHAPFPSYINGYDEYNKNIKPGLLRSIEISGMVGASCVIIHPVSGVEDMKQFNLDLYQELEPYAVKAGVKIALENMFGYSDELKKIVPNVCSTGMDFAEYMDAVGLENFTACVDIGHAGLVGGSAAEMIRTLGHDRVGALHVHDNDNVNDLHKFPFSRELDWEEIISALRDINYQGDFSFEADNSMAHLPKELMKDALTFLNKIGKYFVKRLKQ